jgi:hypothetical protein
MMKRETRIYSLILIIVVVNISLLTGDKSNTFGTLPKLEVIDRDDRFVLYVNGMVMDTKTGLIWAGKDNGYDISWYDAKRYCENFREGIYANWRLPTQEELASLLERSERNPSLPSRNCGGGYAINRFFKVTCCCFWAAESDGSEAAVFSFYSGNRYRKPLQSSSYHRTMPVRDP